MSNLASLERCAVVGDIHCEFEVLERVLDAIATMGIEPVLCVGDLIDGDGDADATLALLEERGVQCVAGNHERWFLAGEHRNLEHATQEVNEPSRAFLMSLPKMRRYTTPNGKVLLCHGVGEDDEAWLLPDTKGYALQDIPTLRELMLDKETQFMIGGHTHERMVRLFPGLTVINVGTLRAKDEQTFSILDFGKLKAEIYSTEVGTPLIEVLKLPVPVPA